LATVPLTVIDNPLTFACMSSSKRGTGSSASVLRRHVKIERRKDDERALSLAREISSARENKGTFTGRSPKP
jgi:hypothetical protein